MRSFALITLGVAGLLVAGCDEMKAGFDKGYAEAHAEAEAKAAAEKAKASPAKPPVAAPVQPAPPAT